MNNRQLLDLKFREQHPIEPFIADFYCAQLKLVIEVDGASHEDLEYDAWRTKELEKDGFSVFRVTNDDIVEDIDGVIERLTEFVKTKWDVPSKNEEPSPAPPEEGGEKEKTENRIPSFA